MNPKVEMAVEAVAVVVLASVAGVVSRREPGKHQVAQVEVKAFRKSSQRVAEAVGAASLLTNQEEVWVVE